MRNVEVKAKIKNIEEVESKALDISDSEKVVIVQKDTFFNVPNKSGRLKLREFQVFVASYSDFRAKLNRFQQQLAAKSARVLALRGCKSHLLVMKKHIPDFSIFSVNFVIEEKPLQRNVRNKWKNDKTGELIFYDRPDTEGPKVSKYEIISFDSENCSKMKNLLSLSNGVLGTVEKTRHLYLVGQTRIHIDKVAGLGHFLELEVVIDDNGDFTTGQKISENLMEKLGIHQDSLISGAYLDLLLNKQ